MNNLVFSILIANYNNGRYFKECYDSIITQTYSNWEVIIVDDSSTDDSVDEIKKIIGEDDRFKLFQNTENYGCGFTKRRCAELANGQICGFLDPDDALVATAIEVMVDYHLKNEKVGHIYSNLIYCDSELNHLRVKKNCPVKNGDPHYFITDHSINHFSTFKKEIYLKTEGINPYMQRAVDMDLYLKLYEVAEVMYIDYDLYIYRMHTNGLSTFQNTNKANYWHWFTIMQAAERRNVNIENDFLSEFYRKNEVEKYVQSVDLIQKSRIIKILQKFGFLKWIKRV